MFNFTLKEKEAKIEQLTRDREMERAQIAKAANQTDEAENKLGQLKEEYQLYKAQQVRVGFCTSLATINSVREKFHS